jgi:hypothetical protein
MIVWILKFNLTSFSMFCCGGSYTVYTSNLWIQLHFLGHNCSVHIWGCYMTQNTFYHLNLNYQTQRTLLCLRTCQTSVYNVHKLCKIFGFWSTDVNNEVPSYRFPGSGRKLPPSFLWGTSTLVYEGGKHLQNIGNQWHCHLGKQPRRMNHIWTFLTLKRLCCGKYCDTWSCRWPLVFWGSP